ncbi:MAG: hypothetical protein VYD64_10235 [Pseudomonadota bacterium]|nr:hypothetical protein [Pseudomonadota bacterium]
MASGRAPRVELRGGPSWATEAGDRAIPIRTAPRHEDAWPHQDWSHTETPGPETPGPETLRPATPRQQPPHPEVPRAVSPVHEILEEVALPPAEPHRGGFADNRSLADFERARRHSRRVSFLKIGLPVFAALALVAMLAIPFISGSSLPSVSIGSTKIENGMLVMDNPRLNGTDANERPYQLTARKAIQDASRPTHITLEEISARLPMSDTSFASVTAGTGIFDAEQ